MSKNKAIKVVTASVIAGSAITAVAPAQSEAATSSVDKAITKANNQITKAFNAYYKEAKYEGKLPSTTTIRKEAKLARDYYEAAKEAVAKNGGSTANKAAYTKKLDANKVYLNRVENYVKAINVNVATKKKEFEAAVKGGTQSKVLAAQEALDQKNAEFKKAVAKVFGPDTRRLLLAKYAAPADKLSATVDAEMAVYKAYRDIERKDLIETDLAAAEKLMDKVKKQVAAIEKKNTKLAKNLMKAVKKNKAAYEAAKASSKQLDAIVNKANNQMKKAFNAYYEEAKYKGKLPSTTTIRKEAKLARDYYEAAKAAIAKNGGSASYTKKLEANKVYLNRVENYVAAINVNVAAKKKAFEAAVKSGTQSKVLAAQEALDQKNAEFKAAVAKVFGPDARRLLLAKYAAPADKLSATVDAEMAVYIAYRQIEREDLIEKDLAKAKQLMDDVEKYVAVIEKKNTKLAQNIMKAVEKNKKAYDERVVSSQEELDAILAKANDGDKVEIYIEATGNLKIATEKALTITLTGDFDGKDLTIDAPNAHVTNKAANSGKITINDVANTSYEQVGTYGSLVVNDTNGGRIINSTSAPLNITIGAGAKVTLVGTFGKVTVLGNAEITLSAGSFIQEVATDAEVTVILGEGAKIETTTGNGIVKTPGGGGPTPTPTLALNKIDAVVSGGGALSKDTANKYTLEGSSTAQLSSLTVEANLDGFTAKIVSIDGYTVNKSFTDSVGDGDTSITVRPNEFMPVPLQNGLSLGVLKSVFGEQATIVLDLTKEGATSVTQTVTLDIKVVEANSWFELNRTADNNIEVEFKKPGSRITDMYDYTQANEQQFLTLLLSFVSPGDSVIKLRDNTGTYKGLTEYTSTEVKNLLGITSSDTTFGDLVGTTIYATVDGTPRTITFVQ
ncbi:hypothetical protein D1953_12870 [Peribacillus asahii]|uniref:SbsC C-terminal domain-containing protein n=1 Tax=Peribacillus asahii TaxID=228899 RepID=A0A398B4I0_9BACI|nr:hypothetical protein [Peribacillus asahii]RID84752.1 hypothetical protein D1953_12870 [Peribacillus asahii]